MQSKKDKIVLTDDQQYVFDNITVGIDTFFGQYRASLRGYAGTGKSTLISNIIAHLLRSGLTVAITTPTHKANKVINKMLVNEGIRVTDELTLCTIHSFLGLKLVYKENKQTLVLSKTKNSQVMPDVLIVDECSMISDAMLEHITTQSSRVRRGIIFVGDDCQLPPVDTEKSGMELSKTFKFGKQFQLTKVMRQAADNPIIGFSISVRDCLKNRTNPVALLKRTNFSDAIYKIKSPNDFITSYYQMVKSNTNEELYEQVERNKILAYTNVKVDDYNRYIRQELFPDKIGCEFFEGEPIVFDEVTESCPFFVQDSVLCPRVERDMYLGIECWRLHFNSGDIVYAIGPDTKQSYDEYMNMLVEAIKLGNIENPLTKRNFCWQDYYTIKNKICVINYPYATTIHKSQGSTFDNIWLDLGYLAKVQDIEVSTRILYTGITRPKSSILLLDD